MEFPLFSVVQEIPVCCGWMGLDLGVVTKLAAPNECFTAHA